MGCSTGAAPPRCSPRRTSPQVVSRIEHLRREHKYSARLITHTLAAEGKRISQATVGRWLVRLRINRLRFLDTTGAGNRRPNRIIARYPGHMVHVDVKKVGAIPDGGAGACTGAAPKRPGGLAANTSATATFTPPWTGSPGWPTPNSVTTRPL